MGNLIEKFHEKQKTLFSISGVRHDVLPGIYIAVFFSYAFLYQFRASLFEALQINIEPALMYTIVGVASIFGGVVLWFISGAIWDPLYNLLYTTGGLWTKSGGRKLGVFYPGYELEKYRKLVRKQLESIDEVYADPEVSIYDPVFDDLKPRDPELYKELKGKLQNSKTFRNTLLPILALVLWSAYKQQLAIALVSTVVFVSLLAMSFQQRATHCQTAYRCYYNRKKKEVQSDAT